MVVYTFMYSQDDNRTHLHFAVGMKHYRQKTGMTQQQLSVLSNLDLTTINQLERKRRKSDLTSLAKIASAMGTTLEEIVLMGRKIEAKLYNNYRLSLSEKITQQRLKKKLTQEELARVSGLSLSTVQKLENGKLNISFDKLTQVLEGLGIDPNKALNWD